MTRVLQYVRIGGTLSGCVSHVERNLLCSNTRGSGDSVRGVSGATAGTERATEEQLTPQPIDSGQETSAPA